MVGLPLSARIEPDRISEVVEPGRVLGASIDERLVGTVSSASSSLNLPGGGVVPHAAVTGVGVLPTHTRRGIASALIRHQLDDVRSRGEIVATLRASEATIYERFGYGVASMSMSGEIDTRRARLRRSVPAGDQVRLAQQAESWEILRRIASDHRSDRPGTIDRPSGWWAELDMHVAARSDPAYVAVHGPVGSESGFVRYRPIDTGGWFGSSARTVVVDDFFAATPAAQAGLIRFLLSLDLVDRIVMSTLPMDSSLPLMFEDQRAFRVVGAADETWLRLVDVQAALSARTFDDEGTVVIGVDDAVLPHNTGCYRISSHVSGAHRIEKTDVAAELRVDVATLASVFLGGYSWRRLTEAGSVIVDDPDAVTMADRLFRTDRAPYAGISF
ncbi:GNAT family N-acetyltransferase [Rhodococcus sp. IEGM 1381]|uniref:GNAT family N-acetyltransferase n=1 Tax=Rhodococcus sp. IEGM 1381 TaxID=3047085 RepID=UPI0024B72D84|nr:GNAT family N-acetyltransferase [Rhodococcus sp. IEGM 1381]MDI9894404.1 GNAT family N-acetyltransferase [Rhodococcus sp. IEGM 1381]